MKYLIDFFNHIIFVCAFLSPVSKVTKQSQNFQDIVKTLDDVSEGLALFGDFTDWQIDCAHIFSGYSAGSGNTLWLTPRCNVLLLQVFAGHIPLALIAS